MRVRMLLPAALIIVGLLAAGCGSASDKILSKAVEKATGGEVDVDLKTKDGEITIKNKDGDEFSTSASTKLPETWPSELELPSGSVIRSSMTMKESGVPTSLVTGEYSGTPEDFMQHFDSKMSGWEQNSDMNTSSDGNSMLIRSWRRGEDDAFSVTVTQSEGKTGFQLMHKAK